MRALIRVARNSAREIPRPAGESAGLADEAAPCRAGTQRGSTRGIHGRGRPRHIFAHKTKRPSTQFESAGRLLISPPPSAARELLYRIPKKGKWLARAMPGTKAVGRGETKVAISEAAELRSGRLSAAAHTELSHENGSDASRRPSLGASLPQTARAGCRHYLFKGSPADSER